MIKHRLKYGWFILLLAAFATLFFYLRMEKPKQLKENAYQEWANNLVITRGDKAYIKTEESSGEHTTLSEAQGYGMLIAAKAGQQDLGTKEEFDRLYRYYLDYRLPESELMSWKQTINTAGEVETFTHNATDGDLYIAYALMEAAKVWTEDADTYQEQAKKILADIIEHNYNAEQKILTVGDWATQDSKFHQLMRTSDVMPQQFEDFYQLTQEEKWLELKDSMLDKLQLMSKQYDTGLMPDFLWVRDNGVEAAEANAVSTEFDGTYSYNACRVPYHLAQSKDKKSQAVLEKMMDFFMTKNRIAAGYQLDGKAMQSYQAASFLAPIFYAAQRTDGYEKLVQQNKFIFMQDLSQNSYYEMALLTMVALESL